MSFKNENTVERWLVSLQFMESVVELQDLSKDLKCLHDCKWLKSLFLVTKTALQQLAKNFSSTLKFFSAIITLFSQVYFFNSMQIWRHSWKAKKNKATGNLRAVTASAVLERATTFAAELCLRIKVSTHHLHKTVLGAKKLEPWRSHSPFWQREKLAECRLP